MEGHEKGEESVGVSFAKPADVGPGEGVQAALPADSLRNRPVRSILSRILGVAFVIRTIALILWSFYFVTSAVSLAAFGLWARVNRVQRWIVRGLFPGVVGFSLIHIAVYVAQIVDLDPIWAGRLEILGLAASALFWVRFDAFLLLLVFDVVGRKWGRRLTWGFFPLGLACGAAAFGPEAWQALDLDVLGLVTLGLGVLGVVTSWQLKVTPEDVREKVELKHLFQPIPYVFFALLPFVLIDIFWGGQTSVFGIKYTVGMVQFLVFNVLYLRFFARWVAFQVGTQQARAVPGAPPREPPADVSPREADIVRLVARGLSNKEIADVLSISPNTVKNHLYSIFAKVKVQSRVQLVQWWNSAGA